LIEAYWSAHRCGYGAVQFGGEDEAPACCLAFPAIGEKYLLSY